MKIFQLKESNYFIFSNGGLTSSKCFLANVPINCASFAFITLFSMKLFNSYLNLSVKEYPKYSAISLILNILQFSFLV
ncbi:hypothetical protein CO165_03920 [Candidatus Roizmanbacteria bacterium CG_4_9_14_3_um_filter_33_18]|uniref:Uncharacterized protein n=1 Tax=Candidatus Roizmanbacteria bacterium CG_4_9_14_3_um_filter_33_18 TaxID=1974841 RepID=A0A2M7XXC2_9BACT|nr:MAG: hypothetical protein CO165_03920 [Candidatus Roizmanbacteria bacterium CG_4_9_14_3_um_filter_33_18]